jgi:hypothetical protein
VTDLSHVRWIAGGTGAGKTSVRRLLASRYDLTVYDGDRAEHGWMRRYSPEQHPYFHAMTQLTFEQRVRRSAEETFRAMPSLHGETLGFLVEDLRAMPADRIVLVDWFGNLPQHLAPLLSFRDQAVFLLPSAEFRRRVLSARYSDPARARANWGDSDHERALAHRLARDELWDAEVRRQAVELGLPIRDIDGTHSVDSLAAELTVQFRLTAW